MFTQPVAALHESSVHVLPSLHANAGLVHVPVVHTSPVHRLPSLQSLGVVVHTPLTQLSLTVHASPSVHTVPSVLAGLEHVPSPRQLGALWH
jgi:hypothetical protein